MLDLELKYIEITREIVLKRAEDLYEIDFKYCIKMFDLGLEQLKVNFETQQNHNSVKHQKVKTVYFFIIFGYQDFVSKRKNLKEHAC